MRRESSTANDSDVKEFEQMQPTRSQSRSGRALPARLAGCVAAVLTVCAAALALLVPASAWAAPSLTVTATHSPSTVYRGDAYMRYLVTVKNSGDTATPAPTNLHVALPAGMSLDNGTGTGWSCYLTASTCAYSGAAVNANADFPVLTVGVDLQPELLDPAPLATFTAFGGGASGSGIAQHVLTLGPQLVFGLVPGSFVAKAEDDLGGDYTRAGGHPFRATTAFDFVLSKTKGESEARDYGANPFENARDGAVNLPPGFVANLTALPGGCKVQEVVESRCPERFAVGRAFADLGAFSDWGADQKAVVYKVEAEDGYAAALAFRAVKLASVTVVVRAKVRPGDFTVTALAPRPPENPSFFSLKYFSVCSYGAKAERDGVNWVSPGCKSPTDSGALSTPFVTNPTYCDGTPDVTSIDLASYEHPGAFDDDGFPDLADSDWKSFSTTSPDPTDCDEVPFEPSVAVTPTSDAPDAAAGLDFGLTVPQDGLSDPEGVATGHVKKTVVELPEGLSVNPSAATGLEGCSDTQMGLVERDHPGLFPTRFNGRPVSCPDGSKLGTVRVTSPLVDQNLHGIMYLGTPKSTDPASGQMLRLFLVVRNDELGLMAKLEGSSVADPDTGRLTATFDNNPQLPFDQLDVHLIGGSKGVLANPQTCGEIDTATTLTSWSKPDPVGQTSTTDVTGDCSFGFAPKLEAGNSNAKARGTGDYSFKFSREDGEQWINGLTAKLPVGLLASVRDLPLCSSGQAEAGACPSASRIGTVDATAGSGDPFVLEQKGSAFLTEGYKGCAYGLQVSVPVIAGPFDGKTAETDLGSINVRQSICVDPTTARVTATSDPFPTIWHGIPVRVRSVTVNVDRDQFMLNPSGCEVKQTEATFLSPEGGQASASSPFHTSDCAGLPFKPRLALSLVGRRQVTTGTHPRIKAVVTQQGTSEAGIEKAVVRLPKSLALDPDNAQALCEFEDGTKPDLENHCPAGSIVGRARAKTPLLNDDLVGNVYFVKNIRKDPTTGNLIRTLPMIIVALRGEIAVNLRGESDTTKSGKLVNTFDNVPDAPISQFNLNINGGANGILAVTRTRKNTINLCTGRHTAEADIDGHNGRRHDTDIRMKTPCTKKQTKAAKRQARRAAAKVRQA